MKRLIILFIGILSIIYSSGQNITLSGRVIDDNGENVISAGVEIPSLSIGTLTNKFGYFNIKVPAGKLLHLHISHLSYEDFDKVLVIHQDTNVFIVLHSRVHKVAEVEIVAHSGIVNKKNLSQINVPLKDLGNLPVLLGVKDVVKSMQILPGIQPGPEGTSQLNIRGGGPDQNIILIDDMPIYYNTHAYGFVSTFNSYAIKSVKLYKGAVPARYNNFSSAVIDIATKDGSLKKRNANLNMDLLSGALSYNGYLMKDKISSTFFLRRSLWDLFIMGLFKMIEGKQQFLNYNFYDFNAKIRYNINTENVLYLSFFNGRDFYNYKVKSSYYMPMYQVYTNETTFQQNFFSNKALSLRWFSMLTKKLTCNIIGVYSHFIYNNIRGDKIVDANIDSLLYSFRYQSKYILPQIVVKNNFNWYISNAIKFNFGINFIKLDHWYKKDSRYLNLLNDIPVNENNIFIDTTSSGYNFSPYFQLNYSSRKINFFTGFNYNTFFVSGRLYGFIEPRISFGWNINSSAKLQLSYTNSHQYYHLVSTSALASPSNLYMPSTTTIPPEELNIYDVSFLYYSQDNTEYYISLYYKNMDNLIHYAPGINFITMEGDWTDYIVSGDGYSYGLELFIRKNLGKIKTFMSYTYSRSWRRFQNINNGQMFPYQYDRPHIFNLALTYRLSSVLQANILFNIYSGHWVTVASHIYTSGFPNMPTSANTISYYSSVNNIRTPAYHRLDISFNYHRPGRKSYWSFGVYNVYNRLNPTYLEPSGSGKLTGISLFPIMPYVSYRLELQW